MRKTLIALAIVGAVAACRGDHYESNGSTDTIKTGQPVVKKATPPPASSTGNSSGSGSTGTSGTLPNGTTNGTAT
jgi:hypothetical protein